MKRWIQANPYKFAALLIFLAVLVFAAWPDHDVKAHNPMTGEGDPADAHDHEHLDALPVPAGE